MKLTEELPKEATETPPAKMAKASPSASAVAAHTARMVASPRLLSTRSSIPPAWRARLCRPRTAYARSPWLYTLVGAFALLVLHRCPYALPGWPPRVAAVEGALVMAQGLWSYASDVIHPGRNSRAHTIDRASAVSLCALQGLKVFGLIRHELAAHQLVLLGAGLVIGAACKVAGYRAILANDARAFELWHTRWHVRVHPHRAAAPHPPPIRRHAARVARAGLPPAHLRALHRRLLVARHLARRVLRCARLDSRLSGDCAWRDRETRRTRGSAACHP